MVSGLRTNTYEERLKEIGLTTLEERRHQTDMIQTYKILHGKDRVEKDTWFKMASEGNRATRSAADQLNLRPQAARLDLRKKFFTNRVVDAWNDIPSKLKQVNTVSSFKNGYKKLRLTMVQHT